MSDREKADVLLNQLPDYQLRIVVAYLQGMVDATADYPNEETIAAIESLEAGGGDSFANVDELFADLGV